ncbi:MAG: hypothetical protein R2731_08845 [Nocardioides sp.]
MEEFARWLRANPLWSLLAGAVALLAGVTAVFSAWGTTTGRLALLSAAALIVILLALWARAARGPDGGPVRSPQVRGALLFAVPVVLAATGLAGLAVVRADQREAELEVADVRVSRAVSNGGAVIEIAMRGGRTGAVVTRLDLLEVVTLREPCGGGATTTIEVQPSLEVSAGGDNTASLTLTQREGSGPARADSGATGDVYAFWCYSHAGLTLRPQQPLEPGRFRRLTVTVPAKFRFTASTYHDRAVDEILADSPPGPDDELLKSLRVGRRVELLQWPWSRGVDVAQWRDKYYVMLLVVVGTEDGTCRLRMVDLTDPGRSVAQAAQARTVLSVPLVQERLPEGCRS